jgi:hypothetical protein
VNGEFGFASIEGIVMTMIVIMIVIAMMMIGAGHLGCLTFEADVLACCAFVAMHGARVGVCVVASMSRESMTGGRAAKGRTAGAGSGATAAHSSATEMAAAPAACAMAAATTRAAPGVTATTSARCGARGTSGAAGTRAACSKHRPRRDQRGSENDDFD